MCKEVENEDFELNEEQNEQVNLEDLSREELLDVVYELLYQKNKEIEIYTDNVQDTKINSKEFENGVNSFSFIAGAFSVLNSVGYPKDLIHEMIINERTITHNQYLQEINNKSSEKIANIQSVKLEQAQI